MKPLKEKVSITLDSDIVEKIKVLAENDDRSFSQYINKVLIYPNKIEVYMNLMSDYTVKEVVEQ